MATLSETYAPLTKKQKGQFLEKILSNADFLKSKEWLRKYIAGAYQKIELDVEQLAASCAVDLGFTTVVTLPVVVTEQLTEPLPQQPKIEEVVSEREKEMPVSEFEEILWAGLDARNSGMMGAKWIGFGRRCRMNLFTRTNPFQTAASLLENLQITYPTELRTISLLDKLYKEALQELDYIKYTDRWEEFGQVARLEHQVNPFIYLHKLILTNNKEVAINGKFRHTRTNKHNGIYLSVSS